MVLSAELKGIKSSRYGMSLNDISWTAGPNSKISSQNCPLNVIYQNCTNGSAPLNEGVTRAPDEKWLLTTSPEPLVQIQNNITEMFLMMPSTKIDQKVQLGYKSLSLNHISLATDQYIMCQDSGERSRAIGLSCIYKDCNANLKLYWLFVYETSHFPKTIIPNSFYIRTKCKADLWPFTQDSSLLTATYISKHLFLRNYLADWTQFYM